MAFMKETHPRLAHPELRLRAARDKSGMNEHEAAAALGVTSESYYDFESYQDELYQCADLADIRRIRDVFQLIPSNLFGGEPHSGQRITTLTSLADEIRKRLSTRGLTVEQFEQQAGWDLAGFLQDPSFIWEKWNVDCLYDICWELQIDWVHLLDCLCH